MNKKRIRGFLWAAFISIMIGMVTQALLSGSLHLPYQAYLWNIGYSLSIGLPLFANGFLFDKFARRFIDWIKHPVRSIFRALTLHLIYTTIVIFFVNWFWLMVVGNRDWSSFLSSKSTFIAQYIIFIFVASIIYAVSFFESWRDEVQQSEMIKREALSLKYQVLQNQVNPHFLFNSLNILGSLIDLDISKAKIFTRELSLFYRDLLMFKDRDIILLKEEIDFVKRYIYLQQIRFGEALQVEIIANEKIDGKVIPLSLQALVENAIKHNEISQANPLNIVVAVSDDYELIIENNIQPKTILEESSKTGLKNLAGRYEFLTGKAMVITKNGGYFRVSLPLIQVDSK